MNIGYARVSTHEQNLGLQLTALRGCGCGQIFRDVGVSGASADRPGLTLAMDALRPGDVLVVWRLDRLGRSLAHLLELMKYLDERGIGFRSVTQSINTTTPCGRLFFHMIAALSEYERCIIAARTREGMSEAIRRGKRIGRPPKLTEADLANARTLIEGGRYTRAAIAESMGVDVSTLRRRLNEDQEDEAA